MSAGKPRSLDFKVTGRDDRPAVLFLHGFLGSRSDWAGVADSLGDGFRCVAVDLPGHGSSVGLPGKAYTIEGAANGLVDLLDLLEVGRARLVGYSMGGRLALYLALRHPDRCAGLFLESVSPGIEDAAGRRARRKDDEKKAQRLESEDFEDFLSDWYGQPLFAPLARDEALLRRTIEARRRNDPPELARSLRGMGTGSQPSLWDELPNLEASTLAIAGELDEKFAGISTYMENLSPLVQAVVVPDAGHNVHDEAPTEYLASLRGFLEVPPTD